MELKEMNYELNLPEDSILPFEQRMLESGLCSFALPMNFIRSRAGLKVRYECCGYVSLEDLGQLAPGMGFEILEKIFQALRASFDCLLNPSRMTLRLDLVFYHPEQRSVRILYLPCGCDPTVEGTLSGFLSAYRGRMSPEGQPYLDRLCTEYRIRNRSLREMANLTAEIRRELYDAGLA